MHIAQCALHIDEYNWDNDEDQRVRCPAPARKERRETVKKSKERRKLVKSNRLYRIIPIFDDQIMCDTECVLLDEILPP